MLGNGLCVREHNRETNRDTFITCEDKEFSEKTELIIKNQLQMAGFYKKQYEDIKVEPVDCKKIVVKHWYFYRFDSRYFKNIRRYECITIFISKRCWKSSCNGLWKSQCDKTRGEDE